MCHLLIPWGPYHILRRAQYWEGPVLSSLLHCFTQFYSVLHWQCHCVPVTSWRRHIIEKFLYPPPRLTSAPGGRRVNSNYMVLVSSLEQFHTFIFCLFYNILHCLHWSEFKSHGSCILSWTVSHNILHCWNCGIVIPNHMLLQRLVDICLLSEELGTSSAQNSNTSNVFLQSVKARNQDKYVCVKPNQ